MGKKEGKEGKGKEGKGKGPVRRRGALLIPSLTGAGFGTARDPVPAPLALRKMPRRHLFPIFRGGQGSGLGEAGRSGRGTRREGES